LSAPNVKTLSAGVFSFRCAAQTPTGHGNMLSGQGLDPAAGQQIAPCPKHQGFPCDLLAPADHRLSNAGHYELPTSLPSSCRYQGPSCDGRSGLGQIIHSFSLVPPILSVKRFLYALPPVLRLREQAREGFVSTLSGGRLQSVRQGAHVRSCMAVSEITPCEQHRHQRHHTVRKSERTRYPQLSSPFPHRHPREGGDPSSRTYWRNGFPYPPSRAQACAGMTQGPPSRIAYVQ